LKTGTPPRLRADSIDLDRLGVQAGDPRPTPFSFRTEAFAPEQTVCHVAYTREATHEIIRANLHRSPLHRGTIEGQGPRYCPSIEDKVVRFADRERHLLFLEPEGRDTDEIYVNGLSTSLPADVQTAAVRSVPGLERAVLTRYGYAVEYDSVPSYQVDRTLQSKDVAGLHLAGQILGTSGYEEAAAQGFVAGVNAARALGGQEAFLPGRAEAYLGVLVDDLVTKEILEPYRMFTSRAEHRLRLRCDNAVTRLAARAREIGLVSERHLRWLEWRRDAVYEARERLGRGLVGRGESRAPAGEWLRRPGVSLAGLCEMPDARDADCIRYVENISSKIITMSNNHAFADEMLREIENDIKYQGYIDRHERSLRRLRGLENLRCPPGVDYRAIVALSQEAREKLDRFRPETVGQASRIDGVRAGDLAVLTVHLRRLGMGRGCVEEADAS
jgi:tRNA uridine 5-carboxymethylaminomethyl modification enzyme